MSATGQALRRTVAVIAQGIAQDLHIGAQLYVSIRRDSVADLAIGEARDGVPLRTDHLMLWMSSCKPVTAIAVAQMWEQGKLGLDDLVSRHVPEFGCNGKESFKVRHLLTHTAGIPNAALQWSSDPWQKMIAEICETSLASGWVPGRDSGYHVASAWYTLAEIVRRLDGRPYWQYVRQNILEPLEMKDSWIGMPPGKHGAYGDRIVAMHAGALHGARPQPFGADYAAPYRFWSGSEQACGICRPGGSAWGPIRELGVFYEALLAGGRGIIRPQTVEAIASRHTAGLHDRTFGYPLDRALEW